MLRRSLIKDSIMISSAKRPWNLNHYHNHVHALTIYTHFGPHILKPDWRMFSFYHRRLGLGSCIRRYGHSCIGGHGKRTQLPALWNSVDIQQSPLPGFTRDGWYPMPKLPSDNLLKAQREGRLFSYPSAEDVWKELMRQRQQYASEESVKK